MTARGITETVYEVLLDVAKQRHPELEQVRASDTLQGDLGLQSLDLAQIVARLEMELESDPFLELVSITSVRTVADVVSAYERAASNSTAGVDVDLEAAAERALARRSPGGGS